MTASQSHPPTLLTVGAHHDDSELMAGTLAAHRRAGWRVVSTVVTNGCYIDGRISPQHVERREAESRKAADLIQMQCEFLRVAEGTLVTTEAHLKALISVIRRWRPQIVVTHPPVDYHREHEWVSRMTLDAVASCWNPAVETGELPVPTPMVYYADAWFVPFEPDEYVDIGEFVKVKTEMLRCHRSQLPPPSSDVEDIVDFAALRARQRGFEAGVRYAEAFRLAPRLGRRRLGKLLQAPGLNPAHAPSAEEPETVPSRVPINESS